MIHGEIVVDNFAGGGGASTGIEMGLGCHVDIAINHDPAAIDMHKLNHPETYHYCESVWRVNPIQACMGRPVGLGWFSPDCRHFSKAKGSKPVDKNIRGLAWIVLRWAALVPMRVFMLENVEEFSTWGPLVDGKPCKERKGETFKGFIKTLTTGLEAGNPAWRDVYHALMRCNYDLEEKLKIYKKAKQGLGYNIEWRSLVASNYGIATIRKRLYMIGRNDGEDIVWPTQSHGEGLKPFKTAADIIDWSIPVRSIFNRKKPLADKTMQRIARGLDRYVFTEDPFIVPEACTLPFITEHANGSRQRNMPADEPLRTICSQVKGGHFAVVTPTIVKCNHGGDAFRGQDIQQPLQTITGKNGTALITSHMIKMRGTNTGSPTDEPIHTISAGGLHIGEVRAFLVEYYGNGNPHTLKKPLHTITTRDRFGIVTVKGCDYQIVDIGMRMLEPHELYAAMSFPSTQLVQCDSNGKKLSKQSQVARCGNAVCPVMAQRLVESNVVLAKTLH